MISLEEEDLLRVLYLCFEQEREISSGILSSVHVIAEEDEHVSWFQVTIEHDRCRFAVPMRIADEDGFALIR